MTLKLSTGLRSGTLSTGSVKSLLDGGFIDIYSGEVPPTADEGIGDATLLCRISVGGLGTGLTFDATPVDGALVKNPGEVWIGTILATGTPAFYRHVTATDDGLLSTTAPRIQGGVAISGSQMNLSNMNMIAGATQTIDHYLFAIPTSDFLKASTGLRNAALATGSVKSVLDGGFINIYKGLAPDTADQRAAAKGAVLLCQISVSSLGDGLTFEAGGSGAVLVKSPDEVWSGVNVSSGTATFYRFVSASDDGEASTTFPRIQGRVAVTGGALNLSDVELVSGATQTIDNYAFAWPTL